MSGDLATVKTTTEVQVIATPGLLTEEIVAKDPKKWAGFLCSALRHSTSFLHHSHRDRAALDNLQHLSRLSDATFIVPLVTAALNNLPKTLEEAMLKQHGALIQVVDSVLQHQPRRDMPEGGGALSSHRKAYQSAFAKLSELREAHEVHKKAVAAPPDVANDALYLNHIGNYMRSFSGLTGALEAYQSASRVLDETLKSYREKVDAVTLCSRDELAAFIIIVRERLSAANEHPHDALVVRFCSHLNPLTLRVGGAVNQGEVIGLANKHLSTPFPLSARRWGKLFHPDSYQGDAAKKIGEVILATVLK